MLKLSSFCLILSLLGILSLLLINDYSYQVIDGVVVNYSSSDYQFLTLSVNNESLVLVCFGCDIPSSIIGSNVSVILRNSNSSIIDKLEVLD